MCFFLLFLAKLHWWSARTRKDSPSLWQWWTGRKMRTMHVCQSATPETCSTLLLHNWYFTTKPEQFIIYYILLNISSTIYDCESNLSKTGQDSSGAAVGYGLTKFLFLPQIYLTHFQIQDSNHNWSICFTYTAHTCSWIQNSCFCFLIFQIDGTEVKCTLMKDSDTLTCLVSYPALRTDQLVRQTSASIHFYIWPIWF